MNKITIKKLETPEKRLELYQELIEKCNNESFEDHLLNSFSIDVRGKFKKILPELFLTKNNWSNKLEDKINSLDAAIFLLRRKMIILEKIRIGYEKSGYNQNTIRYFNIHNEDIQRIKKGTANFTLEKLLHVCKILNVEL